MNKFNRLSLLDHFYELLGLLAIATKGPRQLGELTRKGLPQRGVYFFFEPGESRIGRPDERRVVRVGTHALNRGSKSTLLGRLKQHRGTRLGGGNHRGSVFRKHIGKAILNRDGNLIQSGTWGKGANAPREVKLSEAPIEKAVSKYIEQMCVLWVNIDDEPNPDSVRGFIERNAIGLLSAQEPASKDWLGFYTENASITRSFLWNVNHVECRPDNAFLSVFAEQIKNTHRNLTG